MSYIRKTKIICTIGPATNSKKKIRKLIEAGMNVARINCSHGSVEEHQKTVDKLKAVREEMDCSLAIMLDTKGPEFRIKTFKDGQIELADGDTFTLTTEDVEGDKNRVSVTYINLCEELQVGDTVLINDGLVNLEVTAIQKPNIVCRTIIGGVLSNNKSMNFPQRNLQMEYLSERDKEDLLFACKNALDYIACSFVSCAQDLKDVREFLDANYGGEINLIAKIENHSGIDNIFEILEECSGVMVARGDLGVEVDYDELPAIQKDLIKRCRLKRKLVIVSTEMMESMIYNSRPTRAEISDVANAVYDGAAAIMMSGETAMGKYPVKAVKVMSKIAASSEKKIYSHVNRTKEVPVVKNRVVDAIAHATCTIAEDVKAKGIINFTKSGYTAKLISNFRPPTGVVAITDSKREYYKLAIYWGVIPFYLSMDVVKMKRLILAVSNTALDVLGLCEGDEVVACLGWNDEDSRGYTNAIKVQKIGAGRVMEDFAKHRTSNDRSTEISPD